MRQFCLNLFEKTIDRTYYGRAMKGVIKVYVIEINELKKQLIEAHKETEFFKRKLHRLENQMEGHKK